MNRKIEALLLIASIGGGFMGVSIVLAEIINISYVTFGHILAYCTALALFSYFVYSGVAFANDKSNVRHLKLSFLLQVPWFVSPILSYKIAAGFSLSGIVHFGGFQFLYNMGSDFSFGFLNGQSWGVGLNLAALGLYYLASKIDLNGT